MSSNGNNFLSLLDAQSTCSDDQKSVQEATKRSTSSNSRTNTTYVIPAQRSRMALNDTRSTSTVSVVPEWRRNLQVTPTNPETPLALVQRVAAPSSAFRPMDTVRGASPQFTAEEKIRAGFSWRYKGDINNPKNSSLGISPEENCAIFLTNLPSGTTERILLDALGIHGPFGRVHATSVAPEADCRHPTACAKLAMFNREEAVRVYDFVSAGNLKIAGRTINVAWNNNRSPVQRDLPKTASRVLEILGPVEVVDIHRLSRFLHSNLQFQTQDINVIHENSTERLIKWTFCSFRAQAQVARKALKTEWPGLHVRWGIDPMTLPVNMVPSAQSTMESWFPRQEAIVNDGENELIGDLINFDIEDDSENESDDNMNSNASDIYGA